MRLREHPKIQWPPVWSSSESAVPMEERGLLKEIDLLEKDREGPTRLLLAVEFDGKPRFAELTCDNQAFLRRLYDMIKPLCGREMNEIGDMTIQL